MKKEWYSAREIAEIGLTGVPASERRVRDFLGKISDATKVRNRKDVGGGKEYHISVLPLPSPKSERTSGVNDNKKDAGLAPKTTKGWAWFEKQTIKQKDEGARRVAALQKFDLLCASTSHAKALREIAGSEGVSKVTLTNWLNIRKGANRNDVLPALTPKKRGGGGREAELDERFWDAFKADYLRQAEPSLTSAYRRCKRIAERDGWQVPSVGVLRRRLRQLPPAAVTLARKGPNALKALFPAQERDRSHFHALQAVNADGHKFDDFVRWDDGKVSRPLIVVFQDLYSNKFLSWRYARSENKDMVRLAFGDLIETFGIPDLCWLDNGLAFANKQMTGGISNRYRFKVKPEEPDGIMKQFGVEVHWTTPYAGQSKPIERGFGDVARDIAKHPAFERAYTGNGPGAKPESYSMEHPVPIEEFMRIVDGEIHAHNARLERQTRVCQGVKSFDQAFAESYARSAIKVASAEQVRLCMLAVENLKVRKGGEVFLHETRYWNESLLGHRGRLVTARFDPEDLNQDIGIYAPDGTLICVAQPQGMARFDDVDAAREHNSARKAWIRAQKEMLAAERTMSLRDLVALQPKTEAPEPPPQPQIIRPMFHGNAALKPAADTDEDADMFDLNFEKALRKLRQVREDS